MQQPIVIYLTHATPSVVGNGGVHRSYQVLHELQQAVGVDQVLVITADFLASLVNNGDKAEGNGSDGKLRQWVNFRFGTATRFVKNPYRLFHRTPFATGLHPLIKNYYASRLKELSSTRTICRRSRPVGPAQVMRSRSAIEPVWRTNNQLHAKP